MRKHIYLWTPEYRVHDIHTCGTITIAGDGDGQVFLTVENEDLTRINLMNIKKVKVDSETVYDIPKPVTVEDLGDSGGRHP